MKEAEFVLDALAGGSTQSVSLLRASRLIDDRRSEEGMYLLEEVAAAPRPPREGLAQHLDEAFAGAGDLTIGGIAALIADMVSRTPLSGLGAISEDLWDDIEESPRLEHRDADRLLLQTVLTRCIDARLGEATAVVA